MIYCVPCAPPVHLLVLLIKWVFGISVKGNYVHDFWRGPMILNLIVGRLNLIFFAWCLLKGGCSLLLLGVTLDELTSLHRLWLSRHIWNFHTCERAVARAQVRSSALANIFALLALPYYRFNRILGWNIRCEVPGPLFLSHGDRHALDLRLSIDF